MNIDIVSTILVFFISGFGILLVNIGLVYWLILVFRWFVEM